MTSLRTLSALLLTAALGACVTPDAPPAAPSRTLAPGPMHLFGAGTALPPARANADMAQDFLDLSFRLESGEPLDGFSRFTGPLTLRLTGAVPPTAPHDLAALASRLRAEAGLALDLAGGPGAAITVEFLPRARMQARAPTAACFVAPRVSSWAEYAHARRAELDWTGYLNRDRVAIFIPSDTSPQDMRDCLHEELAQALGPLNDLYRLSDSVFNDDNIHTTLTGFDMLMLRATYAPELQPGMDQAQVAALLPAILSRLNPGGDRPGAALPPTPRAFGAAIARALGPRGSDGARRSAAAEAVAMARGWQDHRTGFALLTLGRLAGRADAATARAAFEEAAAIFMARGLPLHLAHARMQLAAFALADGDWPRAEAVASEALPVAMADQNAALVAGLMMIRAEALERAGQTDRARALRLDSLGWARYGMGSDRDIARRLDMIAALAARSGQKEETLP